MDSLLGGLIIWWHLREAVGSEARMEEVVSGVCFWRMSCRWSNLVLLFTSGLLRASILLPFHTPIKIFQQTSESGGFRRLWMYSLRCLSQQQKVWLAEAWLSGSPFTCFILISFFSKFRHKYVLYVVHIPLCPYLPFSHYLWWCE